MADGARVPIADIEVGDQVLAWDPDTAAVVVETVTATLPHTDTVYTARLSDGSQMSVTEDHLFYAPGDGAWVELADFDTDAQARAIRVAHNAATDPVLTAKIAEAGLSDRVRFASLARPTCSQR